MALYLIAIGGSGARCVESVVHLASAGLMSDEQIKVLFVDPDKSNGNYIRTCQQIKAYNECRDLVWSAGEPCQWMRTEIINLGISTIGAANNSIAEFFNYNAMSDNDPVATDLFDVLYTKKEQSIGLSEGFRGRPAIGSAFMSQLDFRALRASQYRGNHADYLQPWLTILEEIDGAITNGDIKILLCGSVFGGTGASGLPVIARLLDDFYTGNSIGGGALTSTGKTPRDNLTIGSLLVLPYFGFTANGAKIPQDAVYASAPEFALNTAAAMQYYKDQMQGVCDVFYCIGDQNRVDVEFSVGGEDQKNKAHIVELYAALAVRDFLYLKKPANNQKIIFAERRSEKYIGWTDLPCEPSSIKYAPINEGFDNPEEPVVRHALRATVRFAFAWYNTIIPELEEYSEGKLSRGQIKTLQVWLESFFNMHRRDTHLPDLTNPVVPTSNAEVITQWCVNFASWLNEIHQSSSEEIKLFFMDRVMSPKEIYFGRLVQDDSRPEAQQEADTVDLVKLKLDPREGWIDRKQIKTDGYVGLAKFMYLICGL
jgi:hypothetical protein